MFVECSVPTSSAKDVTIKKTRMCGDALTSLINNQICSGVFRLQGTVPFSHPKSLKKGTLIETGRNRPVSRNQTAILAGTLKSSSKFQITRPLANQKNPFNLLSMQREKVGGFSYKAFYKFKIGAKCYLLRL